MKNSDLMNSGHLRRNNRYGCSQSKLKKTRVQKMILIKDRRRKRKKRRKTGAKRTERKRGSVPAPAITMSAQAKYSLKLSQKMAA